MAAVTLPLTSSDATHRYWWLLILAPIFLALLHPRIVGYVLNRALRLARRQPLDRTADLGTMVLTVAWTAFGWLLLGVHAWLLVRAAGGSGFFLATGAYALSFTAGFLVVIAPGGVGVREAALTVALGPVLATGAPLVVALASRVVMTIADLAVGGSRGAAGFASSGAGRGRDGHRRLRVNREQPRRSATCHQECRRRRTGGDPGRRRRWRTLPPSPLP